MQKLTPAIIKKKDPEFYAFLKREKALRVYVRNCNNKDANGIFDIPEIRIKRISGAFYWSESISTISNKAVRMIDIIFYWKNLDDKWRAKLEETK